MADHLPHRQNRDPRARSERGSRLPRAPPRHHPMAAHPVHQLRRPPPGPTTTPHRPRHHPPGRPRRPAPAGNTHATPSRRQPPTPHHRLVIHRRRPALRPFLRTHPRRTRHRPLRHRTRRIPPGLVAVRATQTRQRPPTPHQPTMAPRTVTCSTRPLVEPTLENQLAAHLHQAPLHPRRAPAPLSKPTPLAHHPAHKLAHTPLRPTHTPDHHRPQPHEQALPATQPK